MEPQPPRPHENGDLSFRPLTEGLGFHPFSDGLPYAPIGKTRAQPTPPPLAKIDPRVVPKISVPPIQKETLLENSPSTQLNQNPQAQNPQAIEFKPGFGYLLRRVMAYLVDSFISAILGLMLIGAFLWQQDSNPNLLLNFNVITVIVGLLALFNWVLTTLQEVFCKTSIGKRVFGLMLYGSALKLFLRAFFFLTSLGFFGMGLFWSLIDGQKCCWHDRAVGIQPKELALL